MKDTSVLVAVWLLFQTSLPLVAQSPVTYQRAAQTALQSQTSKRDADCPNARSTVEEDACLLDVQRQTEEDFETFYRSLESLLGVSNANVERLRAAEDHWMQFRKKSCDAIDYLYQGGSIRVSAVTRCHVRLIRSHMLDLDAIYHTVLHN